MSYRLSDIEYEAYRKALFYFLPLEVLSNRDFSKSDLFRLLLEVLPKSELPLHELETSAFEYASVIE